MEKGHQRLSSFVPHMRAAHVLHLAQRQSPGTDNSCYCFCQSSLTTHLSGKWLKGLLCCCLLYGQMLIIKPNAASRCVSTDGHSGEVLGAFSVMARHSKRRRQAYLCPVVQERGPHQGGGFAADMNWHSFSDFHKIGYLSCNKPHWFKFLMNPPLQQTELICPFCRDKTRTF